MPQLASNIPSKLFYTVYETEALRIARVTTSKTNFKNHYSALISRMVKLRVNANIFSKTLTKAFIRHFKIYFFATSLEFVEFALKISILHCFDLDRLWNTLYVLIPFDCYTDFGEAEYWHHETQLLPLSGYKNCPLKIKK